MSQLDPLASCALVNSQTAKVLDQVSFNGGLQSVALTGSDSFGAGTSVEVQCQSSFISTTFTADIAAIKF
jgi:hypothetical protein